jgi:hypothetical protein
MDSEDVLSARQKMLYDNLESVVDVFGPFTQDTGPDGAHYVEQSPFPGMNCLNCSFYESAARMCEIVDGEIQPEAVCKFWIIPENLIGGA